jgi:hypothetical protein
MKKSIFSLLMMSLLVMMTNSCSKSNPSSSVGICSFSKETFQGKTYKFTYKKIDSNGIDRTNVYNAGDTFCSSDSRWRWSLGDGLCTKYQITGPQYARCTTQVHNGTWALGEKNGFKFLAFYWTAGWRDTLYFQRFDCNSFEYDFDYIDSWSSPSSITYKGTSIYSKI